MRQVTKWILATAAAAAFFGTRAVSLADQAGPEKSASTQPSNGPDRRDRTSERHENRDFRMIRDRQGGVMQGRSNDYRNEDLPTEEEWEEIVDFMKVSSPVRLEMYEKLSSTMKSTNDRPVMGARRRIAGRYRDLMSMRDRHPEMYEFALKQTVLEDQILGTMREVRGQGDNTTLRGKLREQVSAYVDNFLKEREARLKKLREMVERETQTIQRDRESMDELVEKQSQRFDKEMSRLLDFWEDPEKFAPQSPSNP